MSKVADRTQDLFWEAARADDDLGYPDDVAFIASDAEWAEDVLWRNLLEGRASVLVGEEAELLLTPLPRSAFDRLRGQVPVSVSQRIEGHATPYATRSRLGRHPLREMRELAQAA